MDNKRCNQRKLSISRDKLLNKRKLSRDVECLIGTAVQEETILPPSPSCNFNSARKLIESLSREYTELEHHLKGIIASELLKLEKNQKEIDKLKRLYNDMKMNEVETKRKRWCNWCELEATFLSDNGHFFFCSTKCEEQHFSTLL